MEFGFFATLTVVSGLAVSVVQEMLKFKFFPANFANKYPVQTNVVLSFIGACIALHTQGSLHVASWLEIISTGGAVAVVAAITYNQLLGNSTQIKAMEGTN